MGQSVNGESLFAEQLRQKTCGYSGLIVGHCLVTVCQCVDAGQGTDKDLVDKMVEKICSECGNDLAAEGFDLCTGCLDASDADPLAGRDVWGG